MWDRDHRTTVPCGVCNQISRRPVRSTRPTINGAVFRHVPHAIQSPTRSFLTLLFSTNFERDVKAHTFPIRVPAQPCRVHGSRRATRQKQLRPRFRIRARGPSRMLTYSHLAPPWSCPSRFRIPLLASKDAVATEPDADRRAVRTVWVCPAGTETESEKF